MESSAIRLSACYLQGCCMQVIWLCTCYFPSLSSPSVFVHLYRCLHKPLVMCLWCCEDSSKKTILYWFLTFSLTLGVEPCSDINWKLRNAYWSCFLWFFVLFYFSFIELLFNGSRKTAVMVARNLSINVWNFLYPTMVSVLIVQKRQLHGLFMRTLFFVAHHHLPVGSTSEKLCMCISFLIVNIFQLSLELNLYLVHFHQCPWLLSQTTCMYVSSWLYIFLVDYSTILDILMVRTVYVTLSSFVIWS